MANPFATPALSVSRPGPLSDSAIAGTYLEAVNSPAADEHPIGLEADGHAGDNGILCNRA